MPGRFLWPLFPTESYQINEDWIRVKRNVMKYYQIIYVIKLLPCNILELCLWNEFLLYIIPYNTSYIHTLHALTTTTKKWITVNNNFFLNFKIHIIDQQWIGFSLLINTHEIMSMTRIHSLFGTTSNQSWQLWRLKNTEIRSLNPFLEGEKKFKNFVKEMC